MIVIIFFGKYLAEDILRILPPGTHEVEKLISPEKSPSISIARKLLKGYCYLSLDSVLFESGYRSQRPDAFSFVGQNRIVTSWKNIDVSCHQIKDIYLFNSIETKVEDGIIIASPLRAICDTLYLNPNASFDRDIDWGKVAELQDAIGYPRKGRK